MKSFLKKKTCFPQANTLAFLEIREKLLQLPYRYLKNGLDLIFSPEIISRYSVTMDNMLTWDEIKYLSDSGLCTIGIHSQTHPNLSRILPSNQSIEINGAQTEIEFKTGIESKYFAYTFGSEYETNKDLFNQMRKSSIKLAFTAYGGELIKNKKNDNLAIPRKMVTDPKLILLYNL